MADKPPFEYTPESVHESIAGSLSGVGRKQSGNKLAALENWQQASRKPGKQPLMETGQDKSRAISAISLDPRGGSGAEDDDDVDDRQEISLEERLARDRIMHLHDVFVSAQSSEGLSMEEFRSAMRQVILDESGRIMEDDELDKVRVMHTQKNTEFIKQTCSLNG